MSDLVRRRCGGTPARPRWDHIIDGPAAIADAAAATARFGCGHVVEVRAVRPTEPCAEGERATIVKDVPVVICPHCDGPDTSEPVQLPEFQD